MTLAPGHDLILLDLLLPGTEGLKILRAVRDAGRRLHLDVAAEDRSVLLSVSDHGAGIGETERRGLFRAFRKSARDAAQSAPGVGLGLALSRRLARAIGGELSGATFRLRLPRA